VIASAGSIEGMKAYRDDIRRQAAGFGRDPNSIKVLFLIAPIVDEFAEAAELRRRAHIADAEAHLEWHLASSSRLTGIDFSKYDLDEPLPELDSNGHRTLAAAYAGRTLREIASSGRQTAGLNVTGTFDQVAAKMSEAIDEVGGDGFLVMNAELTRRYITEITDGLIPALQRLGVVRTHYEHALFRDNLLAF
jgi:alkanesulfonate monooxygenase SsuD/methylene tetrahydromethanopterin reductase-like flavin-dependent oxidoreductase (luciferase family)